MKKLLWLGLLFLIGCEKELSQTYHDNRIESFRFTRLYKEPTNADGVQYFEVFRDRESGIEFICGKTTEAYGHGISCFPTGRKW